MSRLAGLASRLGLSDDEVLAIFKLDPLAAIGGDYEHRPEIDILDAMTGEAAELAGPRPLASWARANVALLERGDWSGFEDALERWLRDSGLVA